MKLTDPTALHLRAYYLWYCYRLSLLCPTYSWAFASSTVFGARQTLILWIGTYLVWEDFDSLWCHQWRLRPATRRQLIEWQYCVRCCGRCDVHPLCCGRFDHRVTEKEYGKERCFKSLRAFRGMHLGVLEQEICIHFGTALRRGGNSELKWTVKRWDMVFIWLELNTFLLHYIFAGY
jgi:hypothetical protein